MMDLAEFVEETITQISKGVNGAQRKMHGKEEVGGRLKSLPEGANTQLANLADGTVAHLVSFDVALTVTDAVEGKVGIGIFSGLLSAGGSTSADTSSSEISRVKFTVPLRFNHDRAPRTTDSL